MFAQALIDFQTQFLRDVNRGAEPLIRAGLGNPILWPTGPIVVETIGRKTGRRISVPLLATRMGDMVIVSTVRRDSQWVKNLTANPEARYWLAGRPREATAFVFTPDREGISDTLPPNVRCLTRILQAQSRLLGISFAILTPRI